MKRVPFRLMPSQSNDCRKAESAASGGTIRHLIAEESEGGGSCLFLRRMSAGIGTRFGQVSVGFLVLDRFGLRLHIAESLWFICCARRQGALLVLL
jgi:hypothetical protein